MIFDPLNVMRDSSVHSMPVVVFRIAELFRQSEVVAEVVVDDPMFDRRTAIPVEKSLMTQLSQVTFVFSEIQCLRREFVSKYFRSNRRTYRT